jgi:hypothetical protein
VSEILFKSFIINGVIILLFISVYFVFPGLYRFNYESVLSSVDESLLQPPIIDALPEGELDNIEPALLEEEETEEVVVIHLPTPKEVRALYMTSWVAGMKSWREEIMRLISETNLNSIVIDIKDETGRVSFSVEDPFLQQVGSSERRIPYIKEFIHELNSQGIYVIGRVSVFQDPHFVSKYPELAVRRESDGGIWRDRKNLSWIDASAKQAWDYVIAIAREAHGVGFDEINFDYIRFPSDGDMKNISYPISGNQERRDVLTEFFKYISTSLKDDGIVISADLFGMTASNTDDLGIGQVLEDVLPYFDFVSPMVYPSHYPPGFHGYADPNKVPYEIVYFSMSEAVRRAGEDNKDKLRPWLQDFNYGGIYGRAEVQAQIKAVYDSGLNSYMIWNPSNRYDRSKYVD